MTKRKFYETVITVRVLSEDPIPADLNLRDVYDECDNGMFVGDESERVETALNGKQMADALYKAGSEPGFFDLNDKGGDKRDR